jgi:hypothetical protein
MKLLPLLSLGLLLSLLGVSVTFATQEKPKAFLQQDAADLVVNFWHWDSVSVVKPAPKEKVAHAFTKAELVAFLKEEKIRRSLVVVILDKRDAPEGKACSEDSLVADFHQMGFRRVILQQAVSDLAPDGLPILRDSEKTEANQCITDNSGELTLPSVSD